MFQVRIHGRGGQGVVTAAELLSHAAFREGRHAQAFPSFGSERTGAPVVSFCRIDSRPIRAHDPVVVADAVVVQDPTLLGPEVLAGLTASGHLVLNAPRTPAAADLPPGARTLPAGHVVAVPATDLALEHVGRAVPNVPLLAALAAATGCVGLEAVLAALADRFVGSVLEANVAAARAAYALVPSRPEVSRAAAG